MGSNKMRKLIILLIGIICLSNIVSATLYSDFYNYANYKAKVIDYGKSNFLAFKAKFGTTGYTESTIVLDYGVFSDDTRKAVGKSSTEYFAEIMVVNYKVYVMGKDLAALTEVVNLLTNHENHYAVLRDTYAIWLDDTYFKMYKAGFNLVPYDEDTSYGNCYDVVGHSRYQNNSGYYGYPTSTSFASNCVSNNELYYPYCKNGYFTISYEFCKCADKKCVGTLEDIFNLFSLYDPYSWGGNSESSSIDIQYAITSWINS
jgi:hypothetical protein